MRGRSSAAAILALIAVLAANPAGGAAAEADSIEKADLQLRQNGWVVDSITIQGAEEPGVRHLIASGRIAAPARDVWNIVSEPDDNCDNWPSLREVVVERMTADTTVSRYIMSVPIYPDRRYRLRSVADRVRMKFDFEMVPGYGNVHTIKGYWQVTALRDSVSRVDYVLDTDPGVKLVPGFIVSWATRKTIPRSFAYLKEQTLKPPRMRRQQSEVAR